MVHRGPAAPLERGRRAGQEIAYTVAKAGGEVVCSAVGWSRADLAIKNVHRWHGVKDPYLCSAKAGLREGGRTVDEARARFGCRSFRIDPDRGFTLVRLLGMTGLAGLSVSKEDLLAINARLNRIKKRAR